MKKKIIIVILTGIMFFTAVDNTFARSRAGAKPTIAKSSIGIGSPNRISAHRGGGFGRRRFGPRRRRWRRPSRFCGIRIVPNFIISHSETKVVQETVVIWITNDNGSQTEVKLTKANCGGYIGPKGEYYATLPTAEQLKPVYGLRCEPPLSSVIIRFQNSQGTEVIIILTKDDCGYIGPKGERYETMPTVEQLKTIYDE
ncbi:MAG: hypothetical protein JW806_04545 [Sedimentisphaerales bacterium]|nr:hypothetical protein [Sedimentisphaerales bacterium]